MGQINLDTEFGKRIQSIASDPRYSTFCEVGTWNGKGSTQCFYSGIQSRPTAQLYSVEGNQSFFSQAAQLWNDTPQVTVLYGTLHRNIMSTEEIKRHPLYSRIYDHYDLHYSSEVESTLLSPLVSVPPCDCILLDGGEFSTEGDWSVLHHPGLKVVMLDDTQVIKTNRIYNELLRDPSWKCLYDCPNDRNGWAIFERTL